jgi:hypothetical protein
MTNKNKLANIISNLKNILIMSDIYTLVMLIVYTIFAVIFFPELVNPIVLIITNLALIIGVVYIAQITSNYSSN